MSSDGLKVICFAQRETTGLKASVFSKVQKKRKILEF